MYETTCRTVTFDPTRVGNRIADCDERQAEQHHLQVAVATTATSWGAAVNAASMLQPLISHCAQPAELPTSKLRDSSHRQQITRIIAQAFQTLLTPALSSSIATLAMSPEGWSIPLTVAILLDCHLQILP